MKVEFLLIFTCFWLHVKSYDVKGFDDTILFNIRWPGALPENDKNMEKMVITTRFKEKYSCSIPNLLEKESNDAENYKGPLPIELLSPLFLQSSCSYRLESYWTYEICHGKFIRQYHEDREGKKIKIQEYYLGKWDKQQYLKLLDEMKIAERDESQKTKAIPFKKIDGINLPYLEIEMNNGTLCDLNNKPRSTKLLYVCYMHGKHEVFSLKETSTCQYEVVVLSPLLCNHPKYKPQDGKENVINCAPLDGFPNVPRSLLKMRADSFKFRKLSDSDMHVRVEIHPIDVSGEDEIKNTPVVPTTDVSPVESFLAGKNCLNGGTGWWKYEFCYGKYVEQYHIEKDGTKTHINLGSFTREKHIAWISKNPHKRPKPKAQRKQLSHFYSDGTVCDKTGKPRQTVVKLKCSEESAKGAVSLYLLEPKYCEYVLGVESPLICEILAHSDENGLIESKNSPTIEMQESMSELNSENNEQGETEYKKVILS